MKRIILSFIGLLLLQLLSYAQTIKDYKGKVYIFDGYEVGKECDELGNNVAATNTTMLKGSLFTVEKVPTAATLVIKFLSWDKGSANEATYNLKAAAAAGGKPTQRFFLITLKSFTESCSEHQYASKWDVNMGTLTTPFKFRRNPSLFTTNLNLGASISAQRKLTTNWSLGLVAGLSLSQIVLDDFSTGGVVATTTERPAVTPSFSLMGGYKNINIVIGIGWDIINKTSDVEKSWTYNGKRWFGIGVGISLFNPNTDPNSTPATGDQKKGK